MKRTLLKARIAANLSQKKVSIILGYKTPQFISNWERGLSTPPLKTILELEKIYKKKLIKDYITFKVEELENSLKQEIKELHG